MKENPYNLGIPLTKEERLEDEVNKWIDSQKPIFLLWSWSLDEAIEKGKRVDAIIKCRENAGTA